MDEAGAYAKLLGIRGVPTNVLVDSTGIVRAIGAGNPEIEWILGQIDRRFRLRGIHRGGAGLVVAELVRR